MRIAVFHLVSHRLSCIKQRSVTHTNDVAGNQFLFRIAIRLCLSSLHSRIDLFLCHLALNNSYQDRCRTCRRRNTLCRTDQLSVQFRNNQTDCLCSTCRVRYDVDCSSTGTTLVTLSLRSVQCHLITSVCMNRRHDTALDRCQIIQCLCHRSQAVCRTGSCRNYCIFRLQCFVVYVVNDRRQIISGRCGNNDLTCTGFDMCTCFCFGSVESSTL